MYCELYLYYSGSSVRTTTLLVQSLPPQTVSSLQVTKAQLTENVITPLTTQPPTTNSNTAPPPSLKIESGSITSVPSLQVRTEHVSTVPSLDVKPTLSQPSPKQQLPAQRVSALERIAAQLQANNNNKAPKIKTEAVSTTGLTSTSPTRRSPDTGTQCLGPPTEPQGYNTGNSSAANGGLSQPNANGGSFVTTQTLSKLNVPPMVTGTGSVTATPTSYTTAVTTTASTTTATSDVHQQDALTVLGKRPRKASTKYEDLEQPSTPVRWLVGCLVPL